MKAFKEFLELITVLIVGTVLIGTVVFIGYSAFYAIENNPNKVHCTHRVIKPY